MWRRPRGTMEDTKHRAAEGDGSVASAEIAGRYNNDQGT
jgi:hypothetical protein